MNLTAQQQPTQSRHPWRATLRSTLATLVAIMPLLPEIAKAANVDTVPLIVSALAVNAAVTRILAAPQVEALLRHYLRPLAATTDEPPQERGRHARSD